MSRVWHGAGKTIFNFKSSSSPSDGILEIPFNNSLYSDGNTIERLLVGYQLISAPIVDADVPEPWLGFPLSAAAWFYPNPDFPSETNSTSVEDAMTGDALFSDLLRFEAVRWTDGTDHGWIFQANSGGTVSCKGGRTINDKTTDTLSFGLGGIGGVTDLPVFEPGLYGHLWMKWLVQRP